MTSIVDGSASAAATAAAVTTSDSTIYNPPSRALYVGGTGDVAVRMAGGGNATFSAVPLGTILPIAVDQVLAATTATNILLLR